MVLGDLDRYVQRNELRPHTYPIFQNKLKMVKDLNINCDTIKVLEENISRKISDTPHSNIFTDTSPRVWEIKEGINKWNYIKLKHFRTAKENIIKMKKEPIIWENIFANDTLDKH